MAIRAGELDRRVTLQTRSVSPDSTYGGPEASTSTLATRWARIETLSMQERAVANQNFGTVTHRFTLRWDSTVDAALDSADGISYDSRIFDIRGVADTDEAHVALQVLAEERR